MLLVKEVEGWAPGLLPEQITQESWDELSLGTTSLSRTYLLNAKAMPLLPFSPTQLSNQVQNRPALLGQITRGLLQHSEFDHYCHSKGIESQALLDWVPPIFPHRAWITTCINVLRGDIFPRDKRMVPCFWWLVHFSRQRDSSCVVWSRNIFYISGSSSPVLTMKLSRRLWL